MSDTPLISATEFRARFLSRYPLASSLADTVLNPALLAARIDLENEIPINFDSTNKSEKLMFEDEPRSNGQVFDLQAPVQSITKIEIKYNDNLVMDHENLVQFVKVDSETGQLVFLPSWWYSLNSSAFIWSGPKDHLPLGLEITYVTGYNFAALSESEKEAIKNAIGRRALIANIMSWAVDWTRAGGKSVSMDGVSQSTNTGLGEYKTLIDILRGEEKLWIRNIRKKHGIDAVIMVM